MVESRTFFTLLLRDESIKAFSCAVHLLNKIGKEVSIEIENYAVSLRTLNETQSAFAHIELLNVYFEKVNVALDLINKTFCCTSTLKPLCILLKNIKGAQLLSISAIASAGRNSLVFEFTQANGIVRSHRLQCSTSEVVSAVFDLKDKCSMILKPKVLIQLLDHLHRSTEICLEVTSDSFSVRSFHKPVVDIDIELKGYMSTGLSLNILEIDEYNLNVDTSEQLIFCVKEVRSFLGYCEGEHVVDLALQCADNVCFVDIIPHALSSYLVYVFKYSHLCSY
jgi:hypothetical protein